MKWIFAGILMAASSAFAGSYTQGNGGHLIVCPRSEKEPSHFYNGVTLLDLEEGAQLYGFTYDHLRDSRPLRLEEAFEALLRRLPEDMIVIPTDIYSFWFSRLSRELSVRPSLTLFPGSANQISLARGCRIEQGAIQTLDMSDLYSGQAKIQVSSRFWSASPSALSNDLKAALLFHEYTYRFLQSAAPNCADSYGRIIASFLLSDQSLAMKYEDQVAYIRKFNCHGSSVDRDW